MLSRNPTTKKHSFSKVNGLKQHAPPSSQSLQTKACVHYNHCHFLKCQLIRDVDLTTTDFTHTYETQ